MRRDVEKGEERKKRKLILHLKILDPVYHLQNVHRSVKGRISIHKFGTFAKEGHMMKM
jgi:hypothetical protein